MKKLLCALTGRHKWNTPIDDVPDGALFYRVDCVRCGFSIDGALAKRLSARNALARRALR